MSTHKKPDQKEKKTKSLFELSRQIMRRPTHRLNATSSIRDTAVWSNLYACRNRWSHWVFTLSTFVFQACCGLMFSLFEQAFRIFVDDRQNHILQFRIAHGLGEPGVFGGFLEPGLGVQKHQIVVFGVEVTMPDSQ